MKKKIIILIGILIIAGTAGTICWKTGWPGSSGTSDSKAFVSRVDAITGTVSGVANRYAGVVEAQETVNVALESNRTVKEVAVEVGDEVKQGQLLFEYDLSSIEDSLEEAQLEYDQLVNEAASLNQQISALEKEKKTVSQDNQLSYTIEIETDKMNLKKNEYNQKSKQAEIEKLQAATTNTEVRSTIDGVIQNIDTTKLSSDSGSASGSTQDLSYASSSSSSSAFITILSTGAYRIKGTVNELNASEIIEGSPVIIRSRVDDTQIWKGTMGSIDRESASSSNSSSYNYGVIDTSGDSQTTSSTYPFYVSLESSEGLMLGQHVYIEMDEGQEDQKAGLWLSEVYIVDADTNSPYVWIQDDNGKLKKQGIILGQYDEDLGEYEIASGLSKSDYIAYPSDQLYEGMLTTLDSSEAIEMEVTGEETLTDDANTEDASSMDEEAMNAAADEVNIEEISSDEEMMEGDSSINEIMELNEDASAGNYDESGLSDEELFPVN